MLRKQIEVILLEDGEYLRGDHRVYRWNANESQFDPGNFVAQLTEDEAKFARPAPGLNHCESCFTVTKNQRNENGDIWCNACDGEDLEDV